MTKKFKKKPYSKKNQKPKNPTKPPQNENKKNIDAEQASKAYLQ